MKKLSTKQVQLQKENLMKKRNLRPQQAAPVARETTATSDQQGQVTPLFGSWEWQNGNEFAPFAGDGAE